jgi:hypothetical protein
MSAEFRVDGYVVSKTIKGCVLNRAGEWWYVAGATFETFGTAGRTLTDYQTAMTETAVGASGSYRGDFPACDAGYYKRLYFDSAISSQAIAGDADYSFRWDGSAEVIEAGVGDYEVVLTIRTTGAVILPGARIWLSTDNDRENLAAGPYTTDDSGEVTFNCDYGTKYYIHCHLSGYNFASANFTPASGSVAFTKDIATSAVAAGSASDYADSLLVRMIEMVRKWSDEPKLNSKYTDTWCIERAENVYTLALGEKRRQEQDPIVATVAVQLSSGVYTYQLPACMGPVIAVYYTDANDQWGYKLFYNRFGSQNSYGKGVWVEGHTLHIQKGYSFNSQTLQVEFWPNGCARLHCGTCTLNADGDAATFGATPYLGVMDRSINAYAGSIFRVIKVTGSTVVGNVIQEVPISAFNAVTRVATLQQALDPIPTTDDGSIFYEIAPQIPITLDSILGMRVAWEINAIEQPKKAAGCLAMYNSNLRHLRLDAYMSQVQSAGDPNAGVMNTESYYMNSLI